MDLLRVHSQDLHDHIAQEVGECLESGLYTDLAIRCAQGQTLHAHRLVLAAVSPYLQMVILHFSIARITLQLKKEKSNHFFLVNKNLSFCQLQLLESTEWEEVQVIEMSHVTSDEMQMLLEVIYNGVVEATIEDLRQLILLAHRLYITIPLSSELMQGLDLKLPPRPTFRKPPTAFKFANGASPPKMPQIKLPLAPTSSALASLRPTASSASAAAASAFSSGNEFANKKPKLNIDPATMTTILAHSQNNEHVCPICNSKYSNVGVCSLKTIFFHVITYHNFFGFLELQATYEDAR